jgi:hypothetical protein
LSCTPSCCRSMFEPPGAWHSSLENMLRYPWHSHQGASQRVIYMDLLRVFLWMQLWPLTNFINGYNWWFLWDYTCHKQGDLVLITGEGQTVFLNPRFVESTEGLFLPFTPQSANHNKCKFTLCDSCFSMPLVYSYI